MSVLSMLPNSFRLLNVLVYNRVLTVKNRPEDVLLLLFFIWEQDFILISSKCTSLQFVTVVVMVDS